MGEDAYELMKQAQAKSICFDFDEQLDISEKICKGNLKFTFTREEVDELIDNAVIYSEEERERVRAIIYAQMRKYAYLW